jgi:glyoxylase-like metal-dependent hydrolase (beta-lactamase superfamily II)
MSPTVQAFFDPVTNTISYVVYQAPGSHCAIIDSVLDYDPKSGRTSHQSADFIVNFIRQQRLTVEWILETHAHADHLSAAPYLKAQLGGKIAIGSMIKTVQQVFHGIFNLEAEADGSQFDHLFEADEVFAIGDLRATALYVPGHTPADMAYRIGDAVFVGDTLFMPDVGSARCDFPGGNAHTLYQSVQKLLALPDETRLFMCHDYPPANGPDARGPVWQTTVAKQRQRNIHLHDGISGHEFVAMRRARDATLAMPTLILPAIQLNIHAGQLPAPESNGVRYLKIPLDAL